MQRGVRVVTGMPRGSVHRSMGLPEDMAALEERLWSLAGERLVHEPVASLEAFTDRHTFGVIRSLAKRVDQPIGHLFGLPWLEGYHARVSPKAWRAFARALLEWAGDVELERDALPLAVDSLDEVPPPTWDALRAWAEVQGVAERLDDPAQSLQPLCLDIQSYWGGALARFATVRAILDPGISPPAQPALRDAARAYLAYAAGRRRRMEQRRERWPRAMADPRLAGAAARLAALARELAPREPPPPLPALGLDVRVDEEELRVFVRAPDPSGLALARAKEVWVSLVESRGERALASTDVEQLAGNGAAVRVAAELALDGMSDEEHPLHAGLVRALSRPRWSRLLEVLEGTVAAQRERARAAVEERLVWRVDEGPRGEVVVAPALQRQSKRGWTRGRATDVHALLARPDELDERDRRVLQACLPPLRRYHGLDHGALLGALVGHPRVVFAADGRPARVRRRAVEVVLREVGAETWIRFGLGDAELAPEALLAGYVEEEAFARLDAERDELVVARLPRAVLAIAQACARYATGLPRSADEALLALLARLPAEVGVDVPPRLRGEHVQADATPRLALEPLPGAGLRAELLVRPLEGLPPQHPGEGPRHLFASASPRRYAERDLALERERADEVIRALELDHAEPDGRMAWLLDEPERALELLLTARELGERVRLEWPEGVRPWEVGRAGFSELKVKTKKMTEWLALRGEVQVDEAAVGVAAVLAALRAGRRFVALGPGKFARIEKDLESRLAPLADVAFEEEKELVVAPESAGRLRELLPEDVLVPDADFAALCERVRAAGDGEPEVPALSATLRGYQLEGVRWLLRTAAWSRGACLADDMGLGKTLQALALLVARAPLGPAIVVCPTSVVDNWRAETERFAPSLAVRVYRGSERKEQLEELGPGDVLVTSYDVLVRDVDALHEIELATAVLDEAQALKNPETQRRRAARRLTASFRLALTGTPLENHLGELWSIFDVLVPGLLGPAKHFRDRFAAPIERRGDRERLATLRGLLAPFLLRRTKGEVAPELPERTEVVRTVELSKAELAMYEAERRRAVEALALAKGDPKQRMLVFAALMRLRRLACHPLLVDPASTVRSSKLEEVRALAGDLVREGHRALVFSQFTSHLELVRAALEEEGHETLYLDGATPAAERSKLVRRFQEGSAPFFLISLKAGGTGLNLTAADTVIHLDPWWNPAAEDQASDRSHRIGQTKPVTVLRLVSQGTIEETVLELHAEKRELALGILEGAEKNARLDTAALLQLLGA